MAMAFKTCKLYLHSLETLIESTLLVLYQYQKDEEWELPTKCLYINCQMGKITSNMAN